jgi:hypothetical protein
MGFTYRKKHETKFIMYQTYVDRNMYEWQNSYAYSSIVREFLHLQQFPSQILGGKLMDIKCFPHRQHRLALHKCTDYEPKP